MHSQGLNCFAANKVAHFGVKRNLGLNKGGTFVHSLGEKGLVTQLKLTAEND